MSQFSDEINSIFAKPAKDWSSSEGSAIYKLIKEHGRETVQQALDSVRHQIALDSLNV